MRIVVDEMPETPHDCPHYNYDRSECGYKEYAENKDCRHTSGCPYFVAFKDCFENEISDYDVQKFDPWWQG